MLWRRWRSASGSETPMTISRWHRGDIAPDVHHLRPLTTYSSPSRSIRVAMLVASEDATSGSVIENAERTVPSSMGASQRSCCSGVPKSDRSSMFPVSGAEQLIASGAIHGLRPVISASGAYCRFVNPAPCSCVRGRNRFHSPRRRASALSSSRTGGVDQGSAAACASSRKRGSEGYTQSSMKARSLRSSSTVVSSNAKSIVLPVPLRRVVGLPVLPDRVALLEEGLHAFLGVLGLVRHVAGHALEGDQRLRVAVEPAVGGELGDAHRERALVDHRLDEV